MDKIKIVLSKDGVKREITTPFGICIHRDDLGRLIRALQDIRDRMEGAGAIYGWDRVVVGHPDDSLPNTSPRPWGQLD